jgi:uncharacterized protein YkwD
MENYEQKAKTIFKYINQFRVNPKQLAQHLEQLKQYLDIPTNILSEPNKVQIQMVEGIDAFNDAISFLKSIKPLEPLIWDENLAKSAKEHVDDIGPKGLLQYQSSDGTEPEERICKYGTFIDNLGENIDFGPNDEMGVIVSLTLDDGEENRPHRENLFKTDYKKIGIACGVHQSEYQMCVMDFAYDFIPKDGNNNNRNYGNNLSNNPVVNLNLDGNNFDEQNRSVQNVNELSLAREAPNVNNNQSPFVKLSLENDDFKNYRNMEDNKKLYNEIQNKGNNAGGNEFDDLAEQVKKVNLNKKIVKRNVEVVTKITYVYEDGSTKEVVEKESHVFN